MKKKQIIILGAIIAGLVGLYIVLFSKKNKPTATDQLAVLINKEQTQVEPFKQEVKQITPLGTNDFLGVYEASRLQQQFLKERAIA